MRKPVLLFLMFVVSALLFSQNSHQRRIDSLSSRLKDKLHDTDRVSVLNALSQQYSAAGNFFEALQYANEGLEQARKSKFSKGEFYARGELGSIYCNLGNYSEALKHYIEYLRIKEKAGDKEGIARGYANIGAVYRFLRNYPEAKKNMQTGLRMREEIGDRFGLASSYNNLAAIYVDEGNLSEALNYFLASIKIKEETGDRRGLANGYNNVAAVYLKLNNPAQALANYEKSLSILKDMGDTAGYATTMINKSVVFIHRKEYRQARETLTYGLDLALPLGIKRAIGNAYDLLLRLDTLEGRWELAYLHQQLNIAYRDSMLNEEETRSMVQQQMQFEFDKKTAVAAAEREKQLLKDAEEKRKQKIIQWSLLCGLAALIAVSVFIFRSLQLNKEKNRIISAQKTEMEIQKAMVEEKQKEILDSIRYARKIQFALLTPESYISRLLNKYKKNG